MTDIFLSYNEKDREAARRVAAALESVGWSVWWDRRIPAGETWRGVLQRALENMRCMIVLWSSKSIESEWVCEEASEGRAQGKLVPVMIEAVRPPAGFREIQAADLTNWDGSREFEGMRLLIADLEALLGKPITDAATRPAPAETARRAVAARDDAGRPYAATDLPGEASAAQAVPRRRLLAWLLAAALALAGGAAYLAQSWREFRAPPVAQAERRLPSTLPSSAETSPPPRPAASPATTRSTQVPERPTVPPATTPSAPPAAAPPARERPAAPSRTEARAEPRAAASASRCSDLLARVQLGETLSDEAQSRLEKECRQ